eukprot:3457307-Pyramimonas_sp.AAC.1
MAVVSLLSSWPPSARSKPSAKSNKARRCTKLPVAIFTCLFVLAEALQALIESLVALGVESRLLTDKIPHNKRLSDEHDESVRLCRPARNTLVSPFEPTHNRHYIGRGDVQGAHLRVRRCGVRDVRRGHLAILAKALHQLGGVTVKVVAHVRERNLARVQVLEGGVHRL